MDFNEYQQKAVSTAIYGAGNAVVYPALGLAGEAGEVAEKIKKMLRDDDGILTPERKDAIKKEIGDVLWYAAALARDCELNLDDIAKANIEKLFDRRERGVLKGDGDNR